MTIPVWVLVFFALWTMMVLITTVGFYRLSRIFTRRSPVGEYAFPDLDKSDWHRRATRAHLNCVENLSVYGALVLAITVLGLRSPYLDGLAVVFIIARVIQTLIQLSFTQTGRVTQYRFLFFTIQLACMLLMGGWIIWSAFYVR